MGNLYFDVSAFLSRPVRPEEREDEFYRLHGSMDRVGRNFISASVWVLAVVLVASFLN